MNMRWIKASDEKSQHYVNKCCRLIGEEFWFTAYLDWSKNVYVPRNFSGVGSYIEVNQIEYLDESESSSLSLNDIVQEMEAVITEWEKFSNSGQCDGEVFKRARRFLQSPKLKQIGEGSESLLNRLYEEVKHGDQEHQDWLKSKFDDFLKRLK